MADEQRNETWARAVVECEVREVLASRVVPWPYRGGKWDVRTMLRQEAEGLVVQMHGFLAAQPCADVVVRYPDGWMEAVKARWCPMWVLARWPVREVVRHIRVDEAYPDIPLPASCGHRIKLVLDQEMRDEVSGG